MSAFSMMTKMTIRALCALAATVPINVGAAVTDADVPVFITLGQSNADGSAMFNSALDSELEQWYTSEANTGKMKIWYKSTVVQNQTSNALGEAARWAVDGTTVDAEPGWMDLWYKNDNAHGRTSMNMIHGYGTWSTGTDTNCAQGRRGMEGAFGRTFATALPSSELYILKLGVSGSFISSWANPDDDTNWTYFYEKVFKPAMLDLISKGKRPRLAGVWWMQGCADHGNTQSYYQQSLKRLVDRIHNELGFADGKIYIGHIVKPGESTVTPTGSVQYGQGVRNAQDAVASSYSSVSIVDTKDFSMQYEASFNGYLHFDHAGVNAIGQELANRVIDDGADNWAIFSTPGQWNQTDNTAVFTPAFGNPDITYSSDGNVVTATIVYPGFTDIKSYTLKNVTTGAGPGYLDCDGTRYMRIPQSDDFTIPAYGSMTVSFKLQVPAWAPSGSFFGLVCNNYRSSERHRSGFDIFMGSSSAQTLANNLVPDNNSSSDATNFGGAFITSGYTPGNEAHIAWTYDGTTGNSKLWINGVALRETTGTQTQYPISDLCDIIVGARWLLNNDPTTTITHMLTGKISDLRFYSEALTADEVNADKDAPIEGRTLIAAYDFKQIEGLSVKDITGNGHDGTLVGFAPYTSGEPLTIVNPVGGTITAYVDGNEIVSGQNVENGTTVTLYAAANENYTFDSFTVNGEPIQGDSFVMNGATTVTASFIRDPNTPLRVKVFGINESGSRYYRIPAICTTKQGTLIAVADKRGSSISDLPNIISVIAKRSTDGGETWSEAITLAEGNSVLNKTYGDPAIVCDRETGTLLCVFVGDKGFFDASTPSTRQNVYYSKSTDDGLTWTEPIAFSDQIYQDDWYATFCASGAGFQDSKGRIIFVANARLSTAQNTANVYEYLIYTDDLGQTWHVANPNGRDPQGGYGNESKVVELTNGDLLMSMRYGTQRRFMKSSDRGATWSAPYNVDQLVEPSSGYGCNGDIIRYPSTDGQTRLLHTSAANYGGRRDVSVFLSYDEGETWPVKKVLVDGASAYSSLTVLSDGTIGCFVEDGTSAEATAANGYDLYFMRFSLDWLTDGADVPEESAQSPGYLDLDGSRYMYIPNDEAFTIPANGSFTVSFKMNIDSWAATYGGFVTNNYRNSAMHRSGFELCYGSSSAQCCGLNASPYSDTNNNVTNFGGSWITSGYTPGNWAHVVWTYDGSTGASKIYIDGVARRETINSNNNLPIKSLADILVGTRYSMPQNEISQIARDQSVIGKIDDLHFYSESLTAEEVAAEADGILEGKSLIAAYDFTALAGNTAPDISGNGHDGVLVGFPDYAAEGHTITIENPDESKGTIKVYNGDTEIWSGRKIAEGTELNVVAEPRNPYILEAIKVNGKALSEGITTFTVTESTTVSADFVRDPDASVEYVEPTGDGLSGANCYVETASTTGATQNINITRTAKNGDNWELCDDQTIVTVPGQTFSLRLQAKKTSSVTTTAPSPQDLRYCVAFVFTDWDGDGTFSDETPTNSLFNSQRYYGYFNSQSGFGGNIKANYDYIMDISHDFTVPEDATLGNTRIRVIYTEAWDNNINNVTGNYKTINKGYAYDYLVKIDDTNAIDSIGEDGDFNIPVEYFNLQGMRVLEPLHPGIYIRRQGANATKVYVK